MVLLRRRRLVIINLARAQPRAPIRLEITAAEPKTRDELRVLGCSTVGPHVAPVVLRHERSLLFLLLELLSQSRRVVQLSLDQARPRSLKHRCIVHDLPLLPVFLSDGCYDDWV